MTLDTETRGPVCQLRETASVIDIFRSSMPLSAFRTRPGCLSVLASGHLDRRLGLDTIVLDVKICREGYGRLSHCPSHRIGDRPGPKQLRRARGSSSTERLSIPNCKILIRLHMGAKSVEVSGAPFHALASQLSSLISAAAVLIYMCARAPCIHYWVGPGDLVIRS